MANPLAILTSMAGGLSTIGAQGASGALQGQVEGEALRRRFDTEDLNNQLRILQLMQSQSPTSDVSGNRVIGRAFPHGPITNVSELPETGVQAATRKAAEATTQLRTAQTGQVGIPTDPTHAWQKKFADATAAGDQAGADQAFGILKRFSELHSSQGIGSKMHFDKTTDATGNVTYLIGSQQPDGKWTVQQIPMGPIGRPQRPLGGAAGAPRETVTTSTKITPRKEIKDDRQLNAINQALPDIVNELSRKPGFNAPGGFVEIRPGVRVRKEDIIAQAYKQKFGAEVAVRWDGKRFVIVQAWSPEQREPMETRRTVGPPGMTSAQREEDDDSGGE